MSFFNKRRYNDDNDNNDYNNNFDRDYEVNFNNGDNIDYSQPRQRGYDNNARVNRNGIDGQQYNYANQRGGNYNNQGNKYRQPQQPYNNDMEPNSRQSYFKEIGVDGPINNQNPNYYNVHNELSQPIPNAYPQQGVPMQNNVDGSIAGCNMVISTPRNFQDVKSLIVSLSNKQSVIVDIGNIVETDAYRIMDYLSGAIFALKGSIQKIAKNMYALAPHGSSIQIPHDIKNRLKEEN